MVSAWQMKSKSSVGETDRVDQRCRICTTSRSACAVTKSPQLLLDTRGIAASTMVQADESKATSNTPDLLATAAVSANAADLTAKVT